jgi:tetratricopeptide (TPR) repeat protein
LLLILSAFVNLYQVIHYDIYNIEDYFLPVFCISSICLGYADFSFAKKIFTKIVFRTLVIIFLYLLFSKNLFFANKHNFFFAYDYAKNILSNLKENAGILFTRGDDHIFPIWYLQTVEKRNRAMPCIDTVLLTYNWYVTKLANDYPYLGIDKQKFKDYLYLPQDLINELIKDIIQNNHKTREIYSTPKDRFIKENFKLIPYNVFSLVLPKEAKLTESKLNSINEICLNLRGVKDKKIFKDERVELGIITDYKLACFNKALLFYKYKLYEKAKNWLNEVLQIAPKDENVHLYLAIIHQTTKNYKKALENYEKLAKIYQENNQLNKLIQVYKNMADIYYNNLKDIENTIKYCHEILKLNPQDKVIKQTLQRLQYLMQSQ